MNVFNHLQMKVKQKNLICLKFSNIYLTVITHNLIMSLSIIDLETSESIAVMTFLFPFKQNAGVIHFIICGHRYC